MPEPYFVEDDVDDLYAAFSYVLTEEDLPEDRWVVAFQCKPDSDIIHHFNLHLLAPDENGELAVAAGVPQPGPDRPGRRRTRATTWAASPPAVEGEPVSGGLRLPAQEGAHG